MWEIDNLQQLDIRLPFEQLRIKLNTIDVLLFDFTKVLLLIWSISLLVAACFLLPGFGFLSSLWGIHVISVIVFLSPFFVKLGETHVIGVFVRVARSWCNQRSRNRSFGQRNLTMRLAGQVQYALTRDGWRIPKIICLCKRMMFGWKADNTVIFWSSFRNRTLLIIEAIWQTKLNVANSPLTCICKKRTFVFEKASLIHQGGSTGDCLFIAHPRCKQSTHTHMWKTSIRFQKSFLDLSGWYYKWMLIYSTSTLQIIHAHTYAKDEHSLSKGLP